MGGGNKERKQENQQANANYTTALGAASAESPYDKRRREMNESILDWGKSGDYRTPPSEAKVFFNFADVAERKKTADVLANTRGQGVSALGAGANPTLLALDKEHRDGEFEEDAAREYQDTAARVVGGAAGELGDMAGLDQAKRLAVLGSTGSLKQSAMHIPKQTPWWEKLLMSGFNNAQQGAQMAAMGG
jgi:hypothetical protein